jgi:NSS family neurotransmitter:Na+ symporter
VSEKPSSSREKWSSLLAFVWVAAGAAVGLGNVWKFPYMAGQNGGSAFVLIYLGFVALIALPLMTAEIALGKIGRRNAVDNFSYLAKIHNLSRHWRLVGYLGSLTLFLIFCFYSVVAGWSIAYLYFAASNSFMAKDPKAIAEIWTGFLLEPKLQLLCTFLFILSTMAIVYFGVKKGIERACYVMMPGLLLVLIILVAYSFGQKGFSEAFSFLFAFKPEKIEAGVVVASLGHALFTLAVGACAMMVYGSYLPEKTSIVRSVALIAVLDVVVALLAGLAIFPLIFAHDLSPSQGPGLMFVSLPIVFAHMPMGFLWGSLFFILLFFAALSSSLSFAEPLVDLLMGKLGFVRHKAVILVGFFVVIGASICALSFNIFNNIKLFDKFPIFDAVADLSTNVLLPLGAILISVFAGLVVKQNDLFKSESLSAIRIFPVWKFLVLIVVPVAIAVVLINELIAI